MKNPLTVILAAAFLMTTLARAEPLKPQETPMVGTFKVKATWIGRGEETRIGAINLDRFASFSEIRIDVVTIDGQAYYQIKESQTLFNNQHVELITLIEIGEYLKTTSYKRLRRSPEGREIERITFHFDDPSWDYPEDTYGMSALYLILYNVIRQDIKETSFYYWLADQQAFRMRIKAKGKERLTTPQGDLPHSKIKMEPDVRSILPVGKFLARILQPFMSESYIWYYENESSISLKAELALGPGMPRMVIEVLEGNIFGKSVGQSISKENPIE